jgi:hypothetical protein
VGEAGVVDHDVDAAEGFHRRGDHGIDIGLPGNVAYDVDGRGPDPFRDVASTLAIEIGDDDLGAFLGKEFSDPASKAGGDTGDDCDFVSETRALSLDPCRWKRSERVARSRAKPFRRSRRGERLRLGRC